MGTNERKGLSIASMILGILGLVLACLAIGFIPAIIGLILGIIALAKHNGGRGMAIAGVVTSVIALIIAIIMFSMGASVADALNKESNKKLNKGSYSSTEKDKNADTEDDGVIDFSTDTFAMKLTNFEVSTDYEGNSCLLVYYDYTNNDSDTSNALTDCNLKAFQNGVECEPAIASESNESIDNYMKDIQPGTTINVCQVYKIADTSDVTMEASELISLSNDKDTQLLILQ